MLIAKNKLDQFLTQAEWADYRSAFLSSRTLTHLFRNQLQKNAISVNDESGGIEAVGILNRHEELTRTLDRPCLIIDSLAFLASDLQEQKIKLRGDLVSKILEMYESHENAMFVCRIRSDDQCLSRALIGRNFVKYDSLLIYQHRLHSSRIAQSRVKAQCSLDVPEVLSVVEKGVAHLRTGRFFMDPRIGPSKAVETYVRLSEIVISEGAHVTTVRDSSRGAVAGVAIGIADHSLSTILSTRYGTLWLIVVSPEFEGQGFGRRLFEKFCEEFGHQCDVLEIGTQIDNERALRLYEKSGAIRVGSADTFHKWA